MFKVLMKFYGFYFVFVFVWIFFSRCSNTTLFKVYFIIGFFFSLLFLSSIFLDGKILTKSEEEEEEEN